MCASATGCRMNICLSLGLRTKRHTIAWRNPRIVLLGLYLGCGMHHASNKHLAYGDGMTLDYCEVMTITSDYDMTIITMDNLYSELSYRPTPPDALFVLYGQRADTGGTYALPRSYLHQEWASRRFGSRLLVDFRCVNTCHVWGAWTLALAEAGPALGTWHEAWHQHLSWRNWHLVGTWVSHQTWCPVVNWVRVVYLAWYRRYHNPMVPTGWCHS
jgi:hypothetical protein